MSFTLLVIDKWPLDRLTESMRTMLLELIECRYGRASTVFCAQCSQKDWHRRLGSGVHTDAIIHSTIWIETGSYNMRELTALVTAQQPSGRASAAPGHATAGALPHEHRR